MDRFNFDRSLFTVLEEEYVSSYLGRPYWINGNDYVIRKRVIHYEDKPLIFTFPGKRVCRNGIRGNHKQYPYEYISVSFFPADSNFFTLSNNILDEIKSIYPNIQSNYPQISTIKVVLPTFVRFHKNCQIVDKPPVKTKFEIDSMRIGFSQIRLKYCEDYLQNAELELLAYEIYLA